MIEAAQDLVPLVVLSADRPPELRDCGANQTIQQQEIFGDYVRAFVELPVPQSRLSPRYVVTRIEHALFRSRALPGPVHLNFPFADPLTPSPAEPVSAYARSIAALTLPQTVYQDRSDIPQDLPSMMERWSQQQGLLMIGRLSPHEDPSALVALADRLQWPVFADPLSNVRGRLAAHGYGISSYDLLLRQADINAELMHAPFDTILHLGQGFVSKALLQYLDRYLQEHPTTAYVQVTAQPGPQDPNYWVHQHVVCHPVRFAEACIRGQYPGEDNDEATSELAAEKKAFTLHLQCHQQRARQHILAHISGEQGLSELTVAALCLKTLHQWQVSQPSTPQSALFVGNSMAIRDLDSVYAQLETPLLVGSRGTSGIDGNVSMVAGVVVGTKQPGVMLCGDLTLYHDLNALGTFRNLPAGVVVVVVNNQGGGIFSFLPVSHARGGVNDPERVEQYFGTPHPWDFAGAAQMFGLHYCCPAASADFEAALQKGLQCALEGESTLIEVRSERDLNYLAHQNFYTFSSRLSEDVNAAHE